MRKWLKRLAVVAVVVLTLLVVGVVGLRAAVRRDGAARLAVSEAALDRSDPGWRWDEMRPAQQVTRLPDDRNLTKLCWDVYERRTREFERWAAERGGWLPAPDLNRLPTSTAAAAARGVAAAAADAVALARTARDRPTGGWDLQVPANPLDTSMEHVQRVRTPAALLELDAVLASLDADWPRAVAAAAAGLHLRNAVDPEPGVIPYLVGTAVMLTSIAAGERVVGWGEPPTDRLADLQAGLSAAAVEPRLARAFRSERAVMRLLFDNLDRGELTLNQVGGGHNQEGDGFGFWLSYKARLPADHALFLDHTTRLTELAGRPPQEYADGLRLLPASPPDWKRPLSRLLLPGYHKMFEAEGRLQARLRSAAAGLACERFRQARGRWPTALGELGDLLPAVPLDPYDGQPLRFRRLDDGVVVYSVGPDRQDDGGTLSYAQPQPGEDVGFRLWDVAARRQPPVEDQP